MPKVVDVDERRGELAEAAARLIARDGIGSATMRNVAAEAGWTTGVLAHYFADKREMLLYTFQFSLAGRRARRDDVDEGDPLVAMRHSLEGALPLDADRRRHWMVTVAFCAQAAGDEDLSTAQVEAYREFRGHIAALVRRGGLAVGRSSESLAERLIAAADGIAVQALFDPISWTAARQRSTLREMVSTLIGASVDRGGTEGRDRAFVNW